MVLNFGNMNKEADNRVAASDGRTLSKSLQRMLKEMREVDRDLVNRTHRAAKARRERIYVRIMILLISLGAFSVILAATTGLTQLAEVLTPEKVEGWMPIAVTVFAALSTMGSLAGVEKVMFWFFVDEKPSTKESIRKSEALLYEQIESDTLKLLKSET